MEPGRITMRYIIDAYNLAYALADNNVFARLPATKEDTDKRLINIIREWLGDKNNEVTLVFDGRDCLGDKIKQGNLTIVYAPRDNYYQSADNKILEIAETISSEPFRPELIIVTDDGGIKTKIEKIAGDKGKNIKLESTAEFTRRLRKNEKNEKLEKEEFDRNNIKEINEELLKVWKK